MSVINTRAISASAVLGVDPLDRPDLTEKSLCVFFREELNAPMITPRAIRRAIARGDLVGVRKSGRNLFTRREAIRWWTTSDTDLPSNGGAA